jgi:hypothetical protein
MIARLFLVRHKSQPDFTHLVMACDAYHARALVRKACPTLPSGTLVAESFKPCLCDVFGLERLP